MDKRINYGMIDGMDEFRKQWNEMADRIRSSNKNINIPLVCYEKPMFEKTVIQQLDEDGNVIAEYKSKSEASRATGTSMYGISQVCSGKLETYRGYKWRCVNK